MVFNIFYLINFYLDHLKKCRILLFLIQAGRHWHFDELLSFARTMFDFAQNIAPGCQSRSISEKLVQEYFEWWSIPRGWKWTFRITYEDHLSIRYHLLTHISHHWCNGSRPKKFSSILYDQQMCPSNIELSDYGRILFSQCWQLLQNVSTFHICSISLAKFFFHLDAPSR